MKKLMLCLSIAMLALVCRAAVLTPQQALDRISSAKMKVKGASSTSAAALAMTLESGGSPAVYVFNSSGGDGGFLVLPASDRFEPLLGYSDSGEIAPGDIPPALEAYLRAMAGEVAAAESSASARPVTQPARAASRANIATKISTQWNQKAPYFNLTPVDIDGQHSSTGCVATALAQLVYHYRFPSAAKGSVTYDYVDRGGRTRTISYDFSGHKFGYANMLTNYNSSYTSAQANAVADLMYCVGVAVRTTYRSNGSSSNVTKAMTGMIDNFGFDPGMHMERKDWYTPAEWDEIVYSQLKNVGPVFMSATDNLGGHAFLLDGYSGGYYHVNWGWGGKSDGYFLLTDMNPYSSGSTGFNLLQDIIADFRPQQGGSPVHSLAWAAGVNFSLRGNSVLVSSSNSYGLANYNAADIPDLTLGLELVDSKGRRTYCEGQRFASFASNSGVWAYDVPLAGVAPGTYTAYSVYRVGNREWSRAHGNISYAQSATLTVTASTLSDETVYIIGEPAGGWQANRGNAIKGSNGVFRTTLSLSKTSFFGFAKYLGSSADDWNFLNSFRYGPGEYDCGITAAGAYPVSYPGKASWSLPAGEWQLAFDSRNMKLYVAPVGEELILPEIDENVIYLIGEPAGGWNPRTGKAIRGADGVFTTELELPGKQYFAFTRCLCVSSSDWTTLNANRFGAPVSSPGEDGACSVTESGEYDVKLPCETSWSLPAGKYTLTLDTRRMKLKIDFPEVDPGEPVTIYWDNSAAKWATPHIHYWGAATSDWPGVPMSRHEAGKARAAADLWEFVCPAGTTGLLFNAGDGDATKTGDFTPLHNHVYTSDGDQGHYDDYAPSPEPLPEAIYIIGQPAGGWQPHLGTPLAKEGDEFTTKLTLNELTYFGFARRLGDSDSDWSTLNANRYGPSAPDNAQTDTYSIKAAGAYPAAFPSTLSWNLPAGNWKLLFDPAALTLTVEQSTTGIEDVTVGETVQYFNLQGLPVARPGHGVYIRRQGSQSAKIRL